MSKFKCIAIGVLLSLSLSAWAQTYKIRLVDKGGNVMCVQMQVTGGTAPTTADQLLDLKFGIRWLNSASIDLGTLIQNPTNSYAVAKSGTELQKTVSGQTYEYQPFYIPTLPFTMPHNWVAGAWFDLVDIQVMGAGSVPMEICPSGFDVTTQRNINVELNDYTPVIENNVTMVLPLDLLSFEANRVNDNQVQLDWKTANEKNVAQFVLERGTNGRDFTPLSTMKAKNGFSQTYTWLDESPVSGVNYYHLKTYNQDGSIQVSPVKSVLLLAKSPMVSISPNPIKAGSLFMVKTTETELSTFILTDVSGRVVRNAPFRSEILLRTEGLAAGIYFYEWQSKAHRQTGKIIIQ